LGATRSLKRRKQKTNPIWKEQKKVQREEKRAERGMQRAYVDSLITDMECRKEALHKLSMIFLLVMHTQYGFGVGRLKRLRDKMQSEMDCIVYKYVTVEEIVIYLRDELKMDVGAAPKDPRANHYRQLELEVIKEMSAAFLMALVDEFGFRKKRLEDAYGFAAGLCDMLNDGTRTFEDLEKQMAEITTKGGKKNEGKKNNATSGG
jgi:hypothetical protein